MSVRKRAAPNGSNPARAEMPTPIPSASNSCAREKLASASFDFASELRAYQEDYDGEVAYPTTPELDEIITSAPICGSLSTSLTT